MFGPAGASPLPWRICCVFFALRGRPRFRGAFFVVSFLVLVVAAPATVAHVFHICCLAGQPPLPWRIFRTFLSPAEAALAFVVHKKTCLALRGVPPLPLDFVLYFFGPWGLPPLPWCIFGTFLEPVWALRPAPRPAPPSEGLVTHFGCIL